MRELAVDFGTSNTVAALRVDGGPARLVLFDGWPVLPSAVLLSREGTLVVGQEALRGARLDPARFEPHPKERIDEGEVLLGDTAVPVVALIAAVLRRVAVEAPAVDRVVLTHPAGWYSTRRAVLLAAAREAGWHGDVHLVAEPVAAASHSAEAHGVGSPSVGSPSVGSPGAGVPIGQAVAVFDMGGGTTDIAVLRRTGTGWDVLAEAGLPDFGGRDLDQLLLEHLHIEHLMRPGDAASRRAARALAEDVRAGKEALSQYPQTDIPLPSPLPDAHVTRQELEQAAEPALRRAVELLAATVQATPVSAVYLVGGATRMPLVARLIGQRLGLLPTVVDSPETSVALGALGPTPGPAAAITQAGVTQAGVTQAGVTQAGVTQAGVTQPVAPQAVVTQWANTPPQGMPVPVAQRRRPVAAITAVVVIALIAGGVALAAILNPDTTGTASPITSGSNTSTTPTRTSTTTTPSQDPAAFRGDKQLIAFAGAAVGKADDCVSAMGTSSQGDMYSARNHVRCRFDDNGTPYFANYLSSDNAETCRRLNQEFVDLPGAQWQSEDAWSGGGFTGKAHNITTSGGNTVLWYSDTNSLCGFFGPGSEHNPSMAQVRAAWEKLIRPHD